MKKSFKLKELDCANCAAKMERVINKLECIKSCSISFMTEKITIEAEDEIFDTALAEAQKAISRVEKDCVIIK